MKLTSLLLRLLLTLLLVNLALLLIAATAGRFIPPNDQLVYGMMRPLHNHLVSYVVTADLKRNLTAPLTALDTLRSVPVYSPDGTWLAFVGSIQGQSGLYVTDDPLLPPRLLLADVLSSQPAWSPDSRWLAVRVGQSGTPRTALVEAATGENYLVNETGSTDADPVWSPDGSSVVYVSYRDGNPRLYAVDVQCLNAPRGCRANERLLLRSAILYGQPSWSPDGRWLAFSRRLSGTSQMFTVQTACPQVAPQCMHGVDFIGNSLMEEDWPTWSPDGRLLAYRSGLSRIYLADPETRAVRPLLAGLGGIGAFTWSPDSTQIAVLTIGQRDQSRIWLIDVATSSRSLLLQIPFPLAGLQWQTPVSSVN
jgi:Tol biopolymer transport system component